MRIKKKKKNHCLGMRETRKDRRKLKNQLISYILQNITNGTLKNPRMVRDLDWKI
jgi:hypothetical protein